MRASVAALAAATLVAGCASSSPTTPNADAVKAQLIAQADAWDKAIVRKDRAAIEANLHAAFFQIGRRGERSSRAEFVDGLLDPKLAIDPYTVDGLEVHLHGDTALLTATTRMRGAYDGQRFESHYRYIDVYLRENGVWKIVSVQITGLASPPPATK
jgi:ketosteroid isomerase-like protein